MKSDTAIAESAVKALGLDITLPQDKIKDSVVATGNWVSILVNTS